MRSTKAPVAFEDVVTREAVGKVRWVNAPDEDESATDTIEGRLLIPPELFGRVRIRSEEHDGLAAAVGWTRPVSLEVTSSVRGSLAESPKQAGPESKASGHNLHTGMAAGYLN